MNHYYTQTSIAIYLKFCYIGAKQIISYQYNLVIDTLNAIRYNLLRKRCIRFFGFSNETIE